MSRLTIYLTGHGGWTVKNGYTKVPKNCTFTFYTQNAKLMLASDVYKLIKGTYVGTADMEVDALHNVQNMTLYPDDAVCIAPTEAAVNQALAAGRWVFAYYTNKMAGGKQTLDTIFDVCNDWLDPDSANRLDDCDGIDYVWTCCRDLSLSATANSKVLANGMVLPGTDIARDAGINASQSGNNFRKFDKATWSLGGNVATKRPATL